MQVVAEIQNTLDRAVRLPVPGSSLKRLGKVPGCFHFLKRKLITAAADKGIHFQVDFILEIVVEAGSRCNITAHARILQHENNKKPDHQNQHHCKRDDHLSDQAFQLPVD